MKKTILLFSLLVTACYTQQYTIGNGAQTTIANKVDKRWDLHFLGGLVGKSRVSVNCPSGNATVLTQQTVANALVKGFTFGIIAPSTTTVWCEQ